MQPSFRAGVDIGGTFTDIVLIGSDGTILTKKIPSTSEDYARGIILGLDQILSEESSITEVVHGTTIATNTILEHKGARTGLIATEGFRDVLEIRRLRMPRLYDISWEKPKPLVERYLRLEVDERIDHLGRVTRPLDPEDARHVIESLLSQGVESVAVCLINSYVNPLHEKKIGELLRQIAPHIHVSLSFEVLPEIKEYERTSTTVINAYIRPVVDGYLKSLAEELSGVGVKAPLLVMQSNGGIMSASAAREKPIHIIESGPAAGVIASASLAKRIGCPNVITLDMGGTTAKASIIEDGQLSRAPEYEVGGEISLGSRLNRGGGYLLRAPAIDIAEVGAGGGSIVWVDRGGALRVGPRSAGAWPGPVCYDTGGEEPTLTDVNVVLGYLNPHYLVGGALRLNAEKAYKAIEAKISSRLAMDVHEAAYGIHLIGSSNMTRAARAVSLERGRDPREFVLFAFGGSGPLHAVGMARSLGMKRVVVPPWPGLFSAFGLLFSEVEHHYLKTYLHRMEDLDADSLNRTLEGMEGEALAELRAEGYGEEQVIVERSVDLRYAGQSFELTIPVPPGELRAEDALGLQGRFAQEHERTYGHRAVGDPVELVNLRLIARVVPSEPRTPQRPYWNGAQSPLTSSQRRAYFGPEHGFLETPVMGRSDLVGRSRDGPLIVEEYDSTVLVPPGSKATLDDWGNVIIVIEDQSL